MILRLSLLSLVLSCQVFAISVLIAKESIKYEEKIDSSKVIERDVENINKNCVPITLEKLNSEEFVTSHHINKNRVICEKDIKTTDNKSIVFNFGGVNIEKKGKVVFENSEFIRFKNLDGTIEQIYKDGRLK